jgi:hypothetical protein
MNITVCDAIRARRLLRFVYDGYERVVEPHAYGVNTAGHEAVSAWLAGGWSTSATEPGWRMYLIDGMRDVAALAQGFEGPRQGFNPDDPHFVRLFCQIEEE